MKNESEKLSYDQIISLLSIYESEWEHRNNILWSQTFKFFYLSLFIMILPNITSYLSVTLPNIPSKLFPILGFIASTFSFIASRSYSKRLEAISETYKKVNHFLPESYRRFGLMDIKHGKYFMFRHTNIFPAILYIATIFIAIILITQ